MKNILNLKKSFALFAMTLLFIAASPADLAFGPEGTWEYEVETPDGNVAGEMEITVSEGEYAVTIESDQYGTMKLDDVTMEDDVIEATFELEDMILDFVLEFDGDSMEGVVYAGEDELALTAERKK